MSAKAKNEIQRITNVVSKRFMAEVWPKLDAEKQQPYIRGVRFDWGHPISIVQRLQQYTNHTALKYEKFPLIALYTDIKVQTNKYEGLDGVSLELILANATDPNYDEPTRENKNFIPILRPLCRIFFEELLKSNVFYIDNEEELKADITERFFWGKQGLYGNKGNVFNDYVDAIHIQNLILKLKQDC